jgi:hypothetical protein
MDITGPYPITPRKNKYLLLFMDTFTRYVEVTNFDEETAVRETYKLTLKNRTENIVKLPTKSKGHGIVSKREII